MRPALFMGALFGARRVELRGSSQTDSFDSRDGGYLEQTPGRGGHVGTNATSAGAVSLANAQIRGAIQLSPGALEGTVIRTVGQAHYDSCTIADSPRVLSDVPAPAGPNRGAAPDSGSLQPGTYSTLNLGSGRRLDLSSGSYVFTADVELGSNSELRLEGNVNVFFLGDVRMQGNAAITGTSVPANLRIYGGPEPQSWDFRGLSNTVLACGLYAPRADLDLRGGTDFYGALLADTIHTNGNANFHYDVALGSGAANVILHSRW